MFSKRRSRYAHKRVVILNERFLKTAGPAENRSAVVSLALRVPHVARGAFEALLAKYLGD